MNFIIMILNAIIGLMFLILGVVCVCYPKTMVVDRIGFLIIVGGVLCFVNFFYIDKENK